MHRLEEIDNGPTVLTGIFELSSSSVASYRATLSHSTIVERAHNVGKLQTSPRYPRSPYSTSKFNGLKRRQASGYIGNYFNMPSSCSYRHRPRPAIRGGLGRCDIPPSIESSSPASYNYYNRCQYCEP
ncbi:hypothetical protein ABVK25_012162 [Lepraria finkii]|uniref:Uncharacterized protein n=1 Tax=Lepraria finkii TaxID=1340010 RepID=A0ABR4AHX5_9LECA